MPKTADFIEESKSVKEPTRKKRKIHPNSLKNLVAPWPKGFTPNPGGKNQHDIAEEIAKLVFTQNREQIYKAMSATILTGNPYAFKEYADRAFGKLKERREVTHIHQDVPDADLNKRIADLERELGLAAAIDEAGRVGLAAAGEVKTNGHAKDTDVLSR